MHNASADPPDIGLGPIVLFVFAFLVSLLALRDFYRGPRAREHEYLQKHGQGARLIAAVGFALLPSVWALGCTNAFLLCYLLATKGGMSFFVLPALLFAVGIPGCFVWAVKEYLRPSGWRRRPEWVDRYSSNH